MESFHSELVIGRDSVQKMVLNVHLMKIQDKFKTIDLEEVNECISLKSYIDIYKDDNLEHSCSLNIFDQIFFDEKTFTWMMDKYDYKKFFELWKEWNSNLLMPGTRKQLDAIKGFESFKDYMEQLMILTDTRLMFDRGFLYGSDWLVKEIPIEVRNKIVNFCERNKNLNVINKEKK